MAEQKVATASVRESALAGHFVAGQYGKVGPPGVLLQEVSNLNLTQVSAWSDTADLVLKQVCVAVGTVPSPQKRVAMVGESGSVLPIEPLKWWLLSDKPLELAPEEGFILDQSHSRTCLKLSGEQAATLLNRHLSLDLRDSHCAVNTVQSGSFDHIGVTVWRRQHSYDLFLPRSFAVSLFALLCESAEQFGYELLNTNAQL